MPTSITSKFNELRLHGMRRRWEALIQTRQHQNLPLSEGLEILLQEEKLDREQRRFDRLRKNAKFRHISFFFHEAGKNQTTDTG